MIQPSLIDRDLSGNDVLLRRAIVGLAVCGLVLALLTAVARGAFSDDVHARAFLNDAGGSLTPGSDVKSHGVIIGKVTGIDRTANGKVRVSLQVDGDQADGVPANVRARVLPAAVFGTTYVDLLADNPRGRLSENARIPQALDGKTLELQHTLDETDRVLSAVHPAELASTLAGVANALDGRGAELGETIDLSNRYLGKFEPELGLLRQDLSLTATSLRVLQRTTPDLFDAIDASDTTLHTVRKDRKKIRTILRGATKLSRTGDAFLRANRALIEQAIADTALTFAALYEFRAGFPVGFRAFSEFAKIASGGFTHGHFLDTNVYVKTGGDAPYTAADCPRYGSALGANCPEAN